jgi:hypothetical protein
MASSPALGFAPPKLRVVHNHSRIPDFREVADLKEINFSLSNIAHCACSRCPSFAGRITELIHMDMVTKLFCGHGKAGQ